jgi:hypothetical protein
VLSCDPMHRNLGSLRQMPIDSSMGLKRWGLKKINQSTSVIVIGNIHEILMQLIMHMRKALQVYDTCTEGKPACSIGAYPCHDGSVRAPWCA